MRTIVIFLVAAVATPLTPADPFAPPPAEIVSLHVFLEKDGIVSMEAENASYSYLWKAVNGASGKALECPDAPKYGLSVRDGVIRFDVEFSKPGLYAVYLLGRHDLGLYHNECRVGMDRKLISNNPGLEGFDSYPQYVQDAAGNTATRMWFGPHTDDSRAFHWRSAAKFKLGDTGPVFWNVRTNGRHHIEFQNAGEPGIALDKVVLVHKDVLDRDPKLLERLNTLPVAKRSGPPESRTRR
ncbi:MAG TPA: hypothetical protein VEQ63_13405 [Bryobacteraceae bacterium]|nr:hypothetical protein [Bryobacteraceae bacterium]